MELFQELLFTISFSLIVSLLIAKLFTVSSSFDDGLSSKESVIVEEKIEKEWVVCDSENQEKDGLFKDQVEDSKKYDFESVVKDAEIDGGDGACYKLDEMHDGIEFNDDDDDDDDGGLVESDMGNVVEEDCVKCAEVEEVLLPPIGVGEVKVKEEDEIFDDDWQGIETTELEKRFGAAVGFVESKVNNGGGVSLIDNDVKIELYGLHRVVIEGNCFEPQPMALQLSARANWNSWKRLENLGREDAMERYVVLLSQHVPDWMGSHSSEKQ